MTNLVRVAYLAGITDGEGHIAVFRRKATFPYISPRYSLRVEIGMCSLGTIKWIREYFGGTIYKKKRRKTDKGTMRRQAFSVSWSGREACNLLQKIKPFLITKSHQADIAIDYQLKCPPKTYKLSKDELNRREKAYRLLREAKL